MVITGIDSVINDVDDNDAAFSSWMTMYIIMIMMLKIVSDLYD